MEDLLAYVLYGITSYYDIIYINFTLSSDSHTYIVDNNKFINAKTNILIVVRGLSGYQKKEYIKIDGGKVMFNFPLSVFLDTNIFKSAKYDFSDHGILALLKKHIESNETILFLSNIVIHEVEKHIRLDASALATLFRNAQKEAKNILSANVTCEVPFTTLFASATEEVIRGALLNEFHKFIAESKAICLDNTGINIQEILNNYFAGNPPFGTKEDKKHEFPDALIISKLKSQFHKENPLYIISKDKGFISAFDKADGFYVYSSIKELLNIINKQSELYNMITAYIQRDDVHLDLCQRLKDKIESEEISVDGMDCDRKGYCEGYEYDETHLKDVTDVDFQLSSVDDIDEQMVSVTINCKANISAICTYFDVDNSIWDPEEKEYWHSHYGTIEEQHRPEFDCTIVFSIARNEENVNFTVSDLSFELVLDKDTRISQKEVGPEDPRAIAEAEAMDALEEYYRH